MEGKNVSMKNIHGEVSNTANSPLSSNQAISSKKEKNLLKARPFSINVVAILLFSS